MENKSLKSQMKRANKLGSKYVLMIGENEIGRGSVILRNMETKEQTEIPIKTVIYDIKNIIKTRTG